MEELASGATARKTIAPRIAILGGGIGGLAAAAFLHRHGLAATVYEQAPRLAQVGAGVVVAPNAARQLRKLGALDALRRRAVELEVGWEFRRWQDGTVLSAENLTTACEALYGEQTYTVHRADLLSAIASRVPADTIQLGRKAVSVKHRSDAARVTFADCSTVEVDVLIGADGVHSLVRGTLFGVSPAS